MSDVGVLCARIRKEEKQILAALEAAGLDARHLPPASALVAKGPDPSTENASLPKIIIDRCQNRSVAAGLNRVFRLNGICVLDAGLAATGSRTDVAIAFAEADIPRPDTSFVMAEDSAVASIAAFGFPATIMPLPPGSRTLPVHDMDIAEAVIEHRGTLGASQHAVLLAQSGAPSSSEVFEILVVDGVVVSTTYPSPDELPREILDLSVCAATALGASIVGVEVASTGAGYVVWDIDPVPELRNHEVFEGQSITGAIAACAAGISPESALPPVKAPAMTATRLEKMAGDGVVLSA